MLLISNGYADAVEQDAMLQAAERDRRLRGRTRARLRGGPLPQSPPAVSSIVTVVDGQYVRRKLWSCGMRCGKKAPLG